MQLDIFEHSRDTALRNEVLSALERYDAERARQAWLALAAEYPGNVHLPPLAALVEALAQRSDEPFPDHDALRTHGQSLSGSVEPAAVQALGGSLPAATWLAPLWCQAARRAARLPFHTDRDDDHCAPLWLRGGDAVAAADAVDRIPSWRRIPAPLAWMAEARYRTQGLDASWPLLAELAWLSPARFDALTRRLADPLLIKLRRKFDASFEGSDEPGGLAWFPAWLLTEVSSLAALLRETQPSRHTEPEQAMRLMLELLGLERQGRHRELIERRKALRDSHASLWTAYMKTR